jgi:hypothetical protein
MLRMYARIVAVQQNDVDPKHIKTKLVTGSCVGEPCWLIK